MTYIAIVSFIYIVFLATDLSQEIIKKQWKALKFSIPIYIITFIINILIGLGVHLVSPNYLIMNFFKG